MKINNQNNYYLLWIIAITLVACQSPQKKDGVKYQPKAIKPAVINEEDQVINMVMNLDEVKRKSALIAKESKGKRHLSTYVETPPTAAQPYYWVKVAEDNGGSYVTYYSFGVQAKTHAIMFYDVMQDSLISLSQWRNTTPVDER
ncbi:hypothetical protein ACFQ3S_16215 [Mucilaginibacter terrae]|uniref:hypothetical protein n=1 Tax=Mucilaginibacter terrae TaxID=1955052 RepID=UPI0036320625